MTLFLIFYSAVQGKEWLCLDRAEQVFSQGKPGCHDDEASPTGGIAPMLSIRTTASGSFA
jgi:hypothetical protein